MGEGAAEVARPAGCRTGLGSGGMRGGGVMLRWRAGAGMSVGGVWAWACELE